MRLVDSLYIHFPYCVHLCNYCDFYKLKSEKDEIDHEKYISFLRQSFEKQKDLLIRNKFSFSPLRSIYIGGGTPSLLGHEGARLLKDLFQGHFTLAKDIEFTIEVDPGTITESEIDFWQDIGVNRFSVGIQSFDQIYLEMLDRYHNKEDIEGLLQLLKNRGLNYSVDLMIGAPEAKKERDIKQEIVELINYDPKHFSVYILKPRANYPHKSLIPSDEVVANEYELVCKTLAGYGYGQYEVSNFSKETFESFHNSRYWNCANVAAVGPNATGFLNLGESAIRYQWKSTQENFQIERLNKDQLFLEKVYLGLRTSAGVRIDWFGEKSSDFMKLARQWSQKECCVVSENNVVLSSKGMAILDSLINDLFVNEIL